MVAPACFPRQACFFAGSALRSCHGSVKLYLCALPHPVEERGGVTSSSLAFKATGTQTVYPEQGCEVRFESGTQPVQRPNTHLHYLLCANSHSQQLTPVYRGTARHCPSLWCRQTPEHICDRVLRNQGMLQNWHRQTACHAL